MQARRGSGVRRSTVNSHQASPTPGRPKRPSQLVLPSVYDEQQHASPSSLPAWANELTNTPPQSDDITESPVALRKAQAAGSRYEHEEWELRTETVQQEFDEEDGRSRTHARQLNHYRTLLIRAQSASSAELHDLHSKLYNLEKEHETLKEEHAACSSRSFRWRSEEITQVVRTLPTEERLKLLEDVLSACSPSDIDAQIATLQAYKKSKWDIIGRLGQDLSARIFSFLDLQDIITLRFVCQAYCKLTRIPLLWELKCRQLGYSEIGKDRTWETHFRHSWQSEQAWRCGQPHRVKVLNGHTNYITALKLFGDTFISGSYDGTVRIWNLNDFSQQSISADKPISCLDYLEKEGVLVLGLHDVGRLHIWRKHEIWKLEKTLSGHLGGIRTIAVNERWIVSAGADKVLIVWDRKSGDKIVKFGQQTNICIDLQLIGDYIVAVTVDGIIRTFSILERDMLAQYKLTELVPDMGNTENVMLKWFESQSREFVCGTRNLIIRLQWDQLASGQEMPPKSRQALTPLRRKSSGMSLKTPTPQKKAMSPISKAISEEAPSLTRMPRMSSENASKRTPTKRSSAASFNVQLPVLTRPPKVTETIATAELETGTICGDRIVTATRFAAREGADRQIYLTLPQTGEMKTQPIKGAWSADETLRTPSKNPMSIVMNREKVIYGCSDGSIVIIDFTQ